MDAMRALGGNLDAAGIDRDKMQADESVAKDLMGSTLSGMMTEIVEEKPKVSARHPGLSRPDDPELFRVRRLRLHRQGRDARQVSRLRCRRRPLQAGRQEAFSKQRPTPKGHSKPTWPTMTCRCNGRRMPKKRIRAVPAGFQRRRAKAKIEKTARKLGMTTITLEYAAPMIQGSGVRRLHADLCQQGSRHLDRSARRQLAAATNGPMAGPPLTARQRERPRRNRSLPLPTPGLPEAQSRLERAPEGFMRECTQALIDKHADKIGDDRHHDRSGQRRHRTGQGLHGGSHEDRQPQGHDRQPDRQSKFLSAEYEWTSRTVTC